MSQIVSFCWPSSHTHRLCPLVLSAHVHNWTGIERQHYRSTAVQKAADARHAGYVL